MSDLIIQNALVFHFAGALILIGGFLLLKRAGSPALSRLENDLQAGLYFGGGMALAVVGGSVVLAPIMAL